VAPWAFPLSPVVAPLELQTHGAADPQSCRLARAERKQVQVGPAFPSCLLGGPSPLFALSCSRTRAPARATTLSTSRRPNDLSAGDLRRPPKARAWWATHKHASQTESHFARLQSATAVGGQFQPLEQGQQWSRPDEGEAGNGGYHDHWRPFKCWGRAFLRQAGGPKHASGTRNRLGRVGGSLEPGRASV